jgi:hypothetical protein
MTNYKTAIRRKVYFFILKILLHQWHLLSKKLSGLWFFVNKAFHLLHLPSWLCLHPLHNHHEHIQSRHKMLAKEHMMWIFTLCSVLKHWSACKLQRNSMCCCQDAHSSTLHIYYLDHTKHSFVYISYEFSYYTWRKGSGTMCLRTNFTRTGAVSFSVPIHIDSHK